MKRLLLPLLLAVMLPATATAARILALTPHACEMLYAIDAGDQIVGAVSYCDYPEAAKALPRIGSYERINPEAALRLKPDVAIVMNRNVAGVATLERMGVKIIASHPATFDALFADIETLGAISNRSAAAKALADALRTRLQRIRNSSNSSSVPLFYELWHDPIMTAGGRSFINELIDAAGGHNVFADVDLETPHVNVESVVRAKPQLIIIPLERRNLAEREQFWRQWLGKKNIRFAAIDADLLHRPGPRLLDGLEQLQKVINESTDSHR